MLLKFWQNIELIESSALIKKGGYLLLSTALKFDQGNLQIVSKETKFRFYRIQKVEKIRNKVGMCLPFWSLISSKGDPGLNKYEFKNYRLQMIDMETDQ